MVIQYPPKEPTDHLLPLSLLLLVFDVLLVADRLIDLNNFMYCGRVSLFYVKDTVLCLIRFLVFITDNGS